jgi:putative transposon-encoded protein
MEFDITLTGYEMVDRIVNPGLSSGRVFVPKKWVGKKVRIILIEKVE